MDCRPAALVLVASLLAFAGAHPLSFFVSSAPLLLALEFVVFFASYTTAAPLIGALRLKEIESLREALGGYGW